MKWLLKQRLFFVLLSCILFVITLNFELHYMAWMCYVPIFYLLLDTQYNSKQLLKLGFWNGIGLGAFLFFWSITAIEKYTDGQILLGVVVYVLFSLFNGLVYAITYWLFGKIRRKQSSYNWLNLVLLTFVFVLQDFYLEMLFSGMPWLVIFKGYGIISSLYIIQYASIGGILPLSAFVVIVNAMIANWLLYKNKTYAFGGIATIVLLYIGGYFIFSRFDAYYNEVDANVRIAVIAENTDPSIKWNEQNAGPLVENLQNAHKSALQLKPDIILWTESAVPWTYSSDDDFLTSIWYQQNGAPVTNIIGMNTDAPNETVYNSAYAILPTGLAGARYDKNYLLSLVESPLAIFNLPFLATDGFYAQAGTTIFPLSTPNGKAGVMICNESNVSAVAQSLVNNGADFLLNMSNDGWFTNSKILVQLHFLNARLRAVEQRRDMVVASNLGISGLIRANGEIMDDYYGERAYINRFYVKSLNYSSFYNNILRFLN